MQVIAVIHSIEPLMASPKEGKLTEENMITACVVNGMSNKEKAEVCSVNEHY